MTQSQAPHSSHTPLRTFACAGCRVPTDGLVEPSACTLCGKRYCSDCLELCACGAWAGTPCCLRIAFTGPLGSPLRFTCKACARCAAP